MRYSRSLGRRIIGRERRNFHCESIRNGDAEALERGGRCVASRVNVDARVRKSEPCAVPTASTPAASRPASAFALDVEICSRNRP